MQQRMMLRTFGYCALGVLLTASGCRSPSTSGSAAPFTAVAFQASSLESHYSLRGAFSGTVARETGRLVVHVHDGRVKASRSARHLRLRAGLGRRSSRGWEYDPRGPAIPLLDSIGPGQELQLETLRITIPIDDNLILEPHWLVFELAGREGQREFSTFVCTGRDIFRTHPKNEPIPTGEAYVFWC